jgi:hypothetical protein
MPPLILLYYYSVLYADDDLGIPWDGPGTWLARERDLTVWTSIYRNYWGTLIKMPQKIATLGAYLKVPQK